MNPDTIAIGTILATAIALGGLRGGLVINRTGNVETEIRSVRTELTDRIDSVENRIDGVANRIDGVGKRIEDLRTELIGRSDRLRDEMLESYRRVDAGHAHHQAGFRPHRPAARHAQARHHPLGRTRAVAGSPYTSAHIRWQQPETAKKRQRS